MSIARTFPVPLGIQEADARRILAEVRDSEQRVLDEAVPFPAANTEACERGYSLYRNAASRVMKRWVVAQFTNNRRMALTEMTAVVHCEVHARRELGRSLNIYEERLIGESVRDLVTANVLHRALQAEGGSQT